MHSNCIAIASVLLSFFAHAPARLLVRVGIACVCVCYVWCVVCQCNVCICWGAFIMSCEGVHICLVRVMYGVGPQYARLCLSVIWLRILLMY